MIINVINMKKNPMADEDELSECEIAEAKESSVGLIKDIAVLIAGAVHLSGIRPDNHRARSGGDISTLLFKLSIII